MKFPSVQLIIEIFFKTFNRFPLAILMAIIGSFCSIIIVDSEKPDVNENLYLNILHTCFIGIVWFISIDLFAEFRKMKTGYKIMMRIIASVLLLIYYFLLPDDFLNLHIYRGVIIAIALHLFVSFIPFLTKGKQKAFWNFNQELFLRASVSVVYSAILFIGISVAVGAASYLFGLNISEPFYFKLWIFIVGIFNTFVFLSGVPEDFDIEEGKLPYPVFLKILAQFILLPLVTIYIAIIYVYTIGILVKLELPEGIISYMVLAFSIVGIFSLLLIYPLQDSEKHKWIKIYSKWFYVALIPMIILLFVSISLRINQYGITENRYLIVILAIWLLGLSIYMLATKLQNIKIIPLSLAIVAIIAGIGPLSAFNISKNSQLNRLEKVMIENNIFENGKITKIENLDYEISTQIESIVNHINNTYGYKPFYKYFGESKLDSLSEINNNMDLRWEILEMIGISYDAYYGNATDSNYFYYTVSNEDNFRNITGYDFIYRFGNYFYEEDAIYQKDFQISENKKITLVMASKNDVFQISSDSAIVKLSLKALYNEIHSNYNTLSKYDISKDSLSLIGEDENLKIKFEIDIFEGRYFSDNNFFISNIGGDILIDFKDAE